MEQPNSPVDLRDCIDQLLRFVLESHIYKTLEFDLGLPRDYCSHLLTEDFGDHAGGVPPSPLYKRLALLLYELMTGTELCGTIKEEWSEMLQDKGSQLVNVFKAINFELHVQEPFFTQLKDGLKTAEGRCAAGKYKRIATGALILFNKCLVLEVEDVHSYPSFSEMLEAESLQRVLPGVKTIEEEDLRDNPDAFLDTLPLHSSLIISLSRCNCLPEVLHGRGGEIQWCVSNLCHKASFPAPQDIDYSNISIKLRRPSKHLVQHTC